LAGEEPPDEAGLGLGRADEEVAEERAPPRPRSAASRALDRDDRLVEVADRQRRLARGRLLEPVDRRVADADAALPGEAGEEAGGDRHLVRLESPQQIGEDRD